MVVDRLQLVRQRIDAADRQAEIGVELEGDAERISLQAEPQQSRIAVEGERRGLDADLRKIRLGQRDAAKPLRLRARRRPAPN